MLGNLSNAAFAQGARRQPVVFDEVAALLNESNADSGIGADAFTATVIPASPQAEAYGAASEAPAEVAMAEPDPVVESAPEPYNEPAAVAEPAYSEVAPAAYPETYPEAYVEPSAEPYVEPYVAEPYVADPYVAEPYAVEESYIAPEPASEPLPASSYPAAGYYEEPAAEPLPAPVLEVPVVNLTPADLERPTADSFDSAGSGAVVDSSDLYSTGATGGTEPLSPPTVVVIEQQTETGASATVVATPDTATDTVTDNASGTAPASAAGLAPDESTTAELLPSGEPAQAVSESLPADAVAQPGTAERPNVLINPARNAALPAPSAAPTTQVAGNTGSDSGYSITYPAQMRNNPLQMVVQGLGQSLTQSVDAASYYARTQRPSALPGNGDRRLLFPLSVPAPISSVFGWRVHPIFQTWRFHSGTDFAAEQGTPIVAALSGRISAADFIGGYGLTVVVDHVGGQSQTLYGHMSELFVRPGQVVRQGEVIGRVGSTGNSTGPHLHFEVRRRDGAGNWVAIAPESHLEGSVAQLMNALRGQPFKLGQLSPIPLAQEPFKVRPSRLAGLSTGLLPLLQSSDQETAAQAAVQSATNEQLLTVSTPLERAVAQVVRSLEEQPYSTSRLSPASRVSSAANAAAANATSIAQANSDAQVDSGAQ